MIAFEISLNGKRVCVAGADDLIGLTASVEAFGMLGKNSAPLKPDETNCDLLFAVGGLDAQQKAYQYWQVPTPLKIGDVVQVRILETECPDRPQSVVGVTLG